jgi:hypothetical protein
MIYSKFGTALTLVSKTDIASVVTIQATSVGTADTREYKLADLKADDGVAEINAAIAKLPPKVSGNTTGRRRKPVY